MERIASDLIEKALKRGGSDNITVALVSLDKSPCDDDNRNKSPSLVSESQATFESLTISESANNPGSAAKFVACGVVAALLLVAVALSFT